MLDALHIRFPSSWLGWDVPHLSLSTVPNSVTHPLNKLVPMEKRSVNGVSVTVDPTYKTDYHSDAPVFRGTVDGTSYHVILKFSRRQSFIDALVDEAGVYVGPLVPIQGSSVPKCHGLYAGETEEGDVAACLVLECWGQVLQKPFRLLPIPMRHKIFHKLVQFHRQGVIHGDFAERNVLEKDGDIRLIDFDQSICGHECHCNSLLGGGQLDPKKVGCDELRDVYRHELRLWKN